MANIIKIKRGSGVPGSGVLSGYELGYDTTNNSLYLGVDGANPIKIADSFQGYLSINTSTGKLYASNDLEVNGAADFNSTLNVDGNTTLGGTLTVTGLTTLNGGITADGGAFTVSDTSGNIYTAGTLTVDGSTTLGDSADDTATIRGIVTISDTGRTTTVQGALEVDQTVGIDGDVRVGTSGTSHFTVGAGTGNVHTDGTLDVDGATTLNSFLTVAVGQLTTLGGDLDVTGNTTLTGTLIANQIATFNDDVTIGLSSADVLDVNSTANFANTINVIGLSSLDGGIDVNGKLTVDAATGDIATAGDLTAENATINGDLVVHGTTTTVNSTTVEIADPIFTLGETLAVSDAKDRGIELKYGDTASPLVGFFGLDESTGRFIFLPDATNTSEVFSGDHGDYEVGEIYQPQTSGVYDAAGSVVNASENWNAAAVALGISGGAGGITSATQYDLLQADASGVFQPTKTISSSSGITIDCGTY